MKEQSLNDQGVSLHPRQVFVYWAMTLLEMEGNLTIFVHYHPYVELIKFSGHSIHQKHGKSQASLEMMELEPIYFITTRILLFVSPTYDQQRAQRIQDKNIWYWFRIKVNLRRYLLVLIMVELWEENLDGCCIHKEMVDLGW